MPRIVPLEYVSTTLGLHKSVRAQSSTCGIVLKFCLQLEHTGTTITQTFSGLWLDSQKKEGKAGSPTPFLGNEPRLQWLLNGFLFINFLHLVAIWGLGYLNERRQNPRKEEAVQNEADVDEERRGTSCSSSGIEGQASPPDLPSRSPSDGTPDGDHTTSPLLHTRGASSVYQGYGTHLRQNTSRQGTALLGATTPEEVRRGKLFAALCTTTVVFAWLLFLITSFLKIRSRGERKGHL